MAFRIFARAAATQRGRLLAAGSTLGAVGLAGSQYGGKGNDDLSMTPAEVQFQTSFGFSPHSEELIKPPPDWKGPVFRVRNDYPVPPPGPGPAAKELPPMMGPDRPLPGFDLYPWLDVDFKKDPKLYCSLIKEYCFEGNVINNFVLQDNKVRNWYHAPWMHWNKNGREPLNGLTFERPTPAFELANTQNRQLQTWACGFYNEMGARVFGQIWKDPNDPQWDKFQFPKGTCVFKILLTDATDTEVPSMKNSPSMKAVISPQGSTSGSIRNNYASDLRLLQVDFAVRDDNAEIGWVFGTFMYNGDLKAENAWDRIFPVGIMWGNDPRVGPYARQNGVSLKETWINPEAETLRKQLGGTRPSWGFDGRMNGPADYFRSACASCHSTSSRDKDTPMTFDSECFKKKTQAELQKCEDAITPDTKMRWFRNLKGEEPFQGGDVSGDYSLQLMMGYHNWKAWKNPPKGLVFQAKLVFPGIFKEVEEAKITAAKRGSLRGVGSAADLEED